MKKAFQKVAFVLHEAIKFVIYTFILAMLAVAFALAMAMVPIIAVCSSIVDGGSVSDNMKTAFQTFIHYIVEDQD